MRRRILIALLALTAFPLARAAESGADPFRIVPTPTGCAIILEGIPDEYRVDALADGGVVVGFPQLNLTPQERTVADACLDRYRVSASYGGAGSALELRPTGVEFSGVIRSKGGLQVVFEKVVSVGSQLGGANAASRSYRLGVGDQVKVTVYNHQDLTKEMTIDSDGRVTYPLVGDVMMAGRTVREVQDELTATLGKDYVVNPQVSVEVAKYASQFIYVNGPVKTPGRFPLEGGLTLKDAISLAGGFGPDAGHAITVARKVPGGGDKGPEQIRFSRRDLDMGLATLELIPGDVVTVAEKDYVFIQSEVREPGKYELGTGLTLLRAIAVAKGLTDWADAKHIALIRVVGGQTIRETINLRDVERQKAPDVPLLAGDIIIVPRRLL
jgi:polysaccharide export outer membrane protein